MAQRRPRSSSPQHDGSSLDGYATKRRDINDVNKSKLFTESTTTTSNMYSEMLCPICYETIKDAHITDCGHTFCHQCILKSIKIYKRCPKCCGSLTREQIHQNILLNELIIKWKMKTLVNPFVEDNKPPTENLKKYILNESKNLNLADTNQMIDILVKHKQKIETESTTAQNILLMEFLRKLLKHKEDEKLRISHEIIIIRKDLDQANKIMNELAMSQNEKQFLYKSMDSTDSSIMHTSADETNPIINTPVQDLKTKFQNNILRLDTHFDEFVKSYFEHHLPSSNILERTDSCNSEPNDINKTPIKNQQLLHLNSFREILAKCCQYSTLSCKATINTAADDFVTSNIISSIVFNPDNTHFAIGGVTKRIKIYDYDLIETNITAFRYPIIQMVVTHKISCLSWNNSHRNVLASSDYEGIVNIWDVDTGTRTRSFTEHQKRCWSVDFNDVQPNLIVSGSDDNTVKLWSIKENHSVATLEAKANVCCVKFNPENSHNLAFGSADHFIHYYDLRNLKNEICIFKGHKKAVSYVRFLSPNELISASTDSQLKYWNIQNPSNCLRSYKGHVNEKNFVGLTNAKDYIACGSEDNSVYVYYKEIPKPLFSYKIKMRESRSLEIDRLSETHDFVSAVCFKDDSDIILAANSKGLIKILELS